MSGRGHKGCPGSCQAYEPTKRSAPQPRKSPSLTIAAGPAPGAKTRHHGGQVFGKKWLASCVLVSRGLSRRIFGGGVFMGACRREVRLLARVAGFVLVLSACTTNPPPVEAPQPAPMPDMPSTIRPEEVVGRWG